MKDLTNLETILSLPNTILKKFYKYAQKQIFSADSPIMYEDQTPVVAYILSKGKATIEDHYHNEKKVSKGNIIGLKELITHSKSSVSATIEKGSEVYILDRSCIKEILNKDTQLKEEIDKLIA